MKHFGFAILEKKVSKVKGKISFQKMKNTGRFTTKSGAEDFVSMYMKYHPDADLKVIEDIRGDKTEKSSHLNP